MIVMRFLTYDSRLQYFFDEGQARELRSPTQILIAVSVSGRPYSSIRMCLCMCMCLPVPMPVPSGAMWSEHTIDRTMETTFR